MKDAPFGLAEVEKMRPVTFDWKEKKEQSWEQHDFGFIAEDMEKTNPMFVTYDKDGKIEGVKYTQLTAVLVNAIKEQQAEIEALKAANDNMQREIDALKAQIAH